MALSRTEVSRETSRRVRRMRLETGDGIRHMRLDAGLSLSELGSVVGVHRSHLARIESARAKPSLEVLTAIGVALGADLGIRYFPGSGPRLHDRSQAAMVEALISAINGRWLVELEVPITRPSRGVIDLVLTERRGPSVVAVEVQSQIRRLEEQLRWAGEKAAGLADKLTRSGRLADGGIVHRLLVLRSTAATREIARRYASTLAAAYPARTTDLTDALRSDTATWPGSGVAWMRIDRGIASLMRHPPPGVELGRRRWDRASSVARLTGDARP